MRGAVPFDPGNVRFEEISLARSERYQHLFCGRGSHFFSLSLWRLDGVFSEVPENST